MTEMSQRKKKTETTPRRHMV